MPETESRRDAQAARKQEELRRSRGSKIRRELASLAFVVILVLGAWLWERASPPDLAVTRAPPVGGGDAFAYAPRDAQEVRGGDFTFAVSAPERSRDDTVSYRFHLRKTDDASAILIPTQVRIQPPGHPEAEPKTCLLGKPDKPPRANEEPLEVSNARTALQWSCSYTFPGPPAYVDESQLPNNTTWEMRFKVQYNAFRFLPLGFWPTGTGSIELQATTTILYRD